MIDPVIERLDAFYLNCLRNYSKQMQANTAAVRHWARAVVFKRPFETMAEEELEKAELALVEALEVVKAARVEYAAKQPMKFAEAAE